MNWWLIAPMLAFLALAGVFAWIAGRNSDVMERELAEKQKEIDNIKAQRDKLNTENESLHQANIAWAEQNTHLHAQNADLRDALDESQKEIKALHMQTVEIEEVKPERKPIRRNMSKKAGQA